MSEFGMAVYEKNFFDSDILEINLVSIKKLPNVYIHWETSTFQKIGYQIGKKKIMYETIDNIIAYGTLE